MDQIYHIVLLVNDQVMVIHILRVMVHDEQIVVVGHVLEIIIEIEQIEINV